MLRLSQPITAINGFRIGDTVRLKDGDGRPHIIKSFVLDGLKEFFFIVQFEDGTETMLSNISFLKLKESEDEKIREELVDFIQKEKEYMESKVKSENSPKLMFLMDALAYLERQKEQKPTEQLGGTFTSYDMAKTFTEGQNYVIAHPEKFGLCKSAEWSEEDELHLKNAILAAEKEWGVDSRTAGFLKSIRPQVLHWKPSKDEITTIEVAVKYLLAHTSDAQLRVNGTSILEHLKQL